MLKKIKEDINGQIIHVHGQADSNTLDVNSFAQSTNITLANSSDLKGSNLILISTWKACDGDYIYYWSKITHLKNQWCKMLSNNIQLQSLKSHAFVEARDNQLENINQSSHLHIKHSPRNEAIQWRMFR